MKAPKNWTEKNDKLTREFQFENFIEAVEFINKIVPVAEETQHHPDIELYGYKYVRVSFTTHDDGGKVTTKDFDMAEKVSELV